MPIKHIKTINEDARQETLDFIFVVRETASNCARNWDIEQKYFAVIGNCFVRPDFFDKRTWIKF